MEFYNYVPTTTKKTLPICSTKGLLLCSLFTDWRILVIRYCDDLNILKRKL